MRTERINVNPTPFIPATRFVINENVSRIDIEQFLSADRARELFEVREGRLINLVRRGARAMPGTLAGSPRGDGYLSVKVNNIAYRAHRIIWLITFGRWPSEQIDHINGVRDDNRIENLREVSVQGNQRNQHIRIDNTSGIPGVYFDLGAWRARIKVDGKYVDLGRFKTKEEAFVARKGAEARYDFHPNHGRTDSARRNGLPTINAPRLLRTA